MTNHLPFTVSDPELVRAIWAATDRRSGRVRPVEIIPVHKDGSPEPVDVVLMIQGERLRQRVCVSLGEDRPGVYGFHREHMHRIDTESGYRTAVQAIYRKVYEHCEWSRPMLQDYAQYNRQPGGLKHAR